MDRKEDMLPSVQNLATTLAGRDRGRAKDIISLELVSLEGRQKPCDSANFFFLLFLEERKVGIWCVVVDGDLIYTKVLEHKPPLSEVRMWLRCECKFET